MVRPSSTSIAAFGTALRLRIRLQDIDVIIGLLETLAVDSLNSLQQVPTIKDRLGAVNLTRIRWVNLIPDPGHRGG